MGSRRMWSQCTGRGRRKKIVHETQIYIDSGVTVPQYLVLRMLPVPRVGWLWKSGPAVARENRSRRILHGNEEEGKKEETLTVFARRYSQGPRIKGASQEIFLRGFFFAWGVR